MGHWLVGVMISLFLGVTVSFINYKISKNMLKRNPKALSYLLTLRQTIDIVFLIILYAVSGFTPWNGVHLVIGGAVGATVPTFFFTYALLRYVRSNSDAAGANDIENADHAGEVKGDHN